MPIININNEYLTGYYLQDKFQDELEKTGFEFITDEAGEEAEEIKLHYKDHEDLEKKISYILMVLTDK